MATTSAKGFNSLTQKQQERHRALLASLDIDVKDTLDRNISTRGKKVVQICTDLHRTALLPVIKVIKDVRMMKQFGGIPDERFQSGEMNDDHVRYPKPWNERYDRLIPNAEGDHRRLVQILSPEQRQDIRAALAAWLIGYSKEVESYEHIINAVNFPQYGSVFAGNTLCVAAGTTVVIGPGDDVLAANPYSDQDPYLVTFADVCIEDGGQVQFQVPTQMNITGTLSKKPAGGCSCS